MRKRLLLVAAAVMLGLGAVTPAASAVSYEWNSAVAGSPPGGIPCIGKAGVVACWEAYGDRFWVWDTAADGASAVADWNQNNSDGSLNRQGGCRNSLGHSTWGYCNKNFSEGSLITIWPCRYDGQRGWLDGCPGGSTYMYVRA